MGALTSRKRRDEHGILNSSPSAAICHSEHQYAHISKKSRLEPMSYNLDKGIPSRSLASRLSLYPEPTPQSWRRIHAPYRNPTRWSSINNQHSSVGGEWVQNRYYEAKTRFWGFLSTKKSKKEFDAKHDVREDMVVSDQLDADTDIIDIVEDGHERGSVISDQRLPEVNGLAFESKVEDGVVFASNAVVKDMTRVEDPVRILDSLSLSSKLHVDTEPLYKKLYQSASRSNSKLDRLQFDISLEELKWQSLVSPLKKQAEEDVYSIHLKESFVPLTDKEENVVDEALSNANRRNVLLTHEDSNIEITGEKLQCLRPRAWLNDEVINVYFELLKERERRDPKKFLQCHFFNSFFYKRLAGGRSGYDYKSVRRWTSQKKLGYALINCDKIFVPIHQQVHWCLAVINKKDQKFQYLDSLGGKDSQVMRVLARYIQDEVKDKSGQEIDVSSWEREFVHDLPMQENGSDCGVFMIKYADFYSRGLGLCFSQENMPYFRKRLVKELLQLRAD